MRRFEATVSKNESGGFTVVVPFDPKEAFGRVRAPVRVTVNGHTFRTTLARYGGIDYIGFNRRVREAAGIADGDLLTLELDEEPAVAVPERGTEMLVARGAQRPNRRSRCW